MKTTLKFILITAVLCLAANSNFANTAVANTAAENPQALVQAKVDEVLSVLEKSKGKPAAERIETLRGMVGGLFDFTEMSKRALGIYYNKFSPQQQKDFEVLFANLLENIYLGNIVTYTDQKIVFTKTVDLKAGEMVEVQSEIIFSAGKKMPVYYRVTNKSGNWQVYDVMIEGISFIKNYRDQFKEVLSKNTPDQLLEMLRKKVAAGPVIN